MGTSCVSYLGCLRNRRLTESLVGDPLRRSRRRRVVPNIFAARSKMRLVEMFLLLYASTTVSSLIELYRRSMYLLQVLA